MTTLITLQITFEHRAKQGIALPVHFIPLLPNGKKACDLFLPPFIQNVLYVNDRKYIGDWVGVFTKHVFIKIMGCGGGRDLYEINI